MALQQGNRPRVPQCRRGWQSHVVYFDLLRPGIAVLLVYRAAAKALKKLTTSVSELLSDRSR